MAEDLSNLDLLVVSDKYPHARDPISSSFVKSQVDCLKNNFKNIYVIALSPFVPKLLSHFSFMDSKGRWDGFAQSYKYENVEVYFAKPIALPFEFSRRKRGVTALKKATKIIEDNKINFDIIHAHFTSPAGYVSAKLKESYKKPAVLTIHEDRDWFLSEISSNDKNLMYAWQNVDRLIRVNEKDLKELEKLNIDRSRLLHIPNGFSSDLFKPLDTKVARKQLGLPTDMRILLNIAALQPYKGQIYLIESMKDVLKLHEDVMLYIVGKGPLRDKLKSAIDAWGLQDKVILAGGDKTTEEIPLWMNACDLFVLPSLSEGNPTVMFEALGCGKPFVGTDVGGIPEIIANEKLGILVEPKDVAGLSKAILRALDNTWDRDYVLDYAGQFTWDEVVKRIVKVYEKLVEDASIR